jgi:tetratricopeptide (TPR) repeat protein
MPSTSLHSAGLRALQKQSADADARDVLPQAHRDLYDLCTDYLRGVEQALQSPSLAAEGRLALRSGQERVRALQRHHLLTWARGSARAFTHEAQQRVRLYEKLETANRALECIDSALKVYPDEEELKVSARAVRDFITSSRVAHWVELAERAAFKGYYRRAIDRYRDALFYLTRDGADHDRAAGAERITREIDMLRARLATGKGTVDSAPFDRNKGQRD